MNRLKAWTKPIAGPAHKAWESKIMINLVRPLLPELNFITIHYLYFMFVTLIAAIIFWGSSNPSQSVSFTDSLFLTISAMTEAGLNTVNLSQITTFQQFILFFLIMIGSTIFVSAFVVFVRMKAFEDHFRQTIKEMKRRRYEEYKNKGNKDPETPSRTKSFLRKNTQIPPHSQRQNLHTVAEEDSHIDTNNRESPAETGESVASLSSTEREKSGDGIEAAQASTAKSSGLRHGLTPLNIGTETDANRNATSPMSPSADVVLSPVRDLGIRRTYTVYDRKPSDSPAKHTGRALVSFGGVGAIAGASLLTRRTTGLTDQSGSPVTLPPDSNACKTDKWFPSKAGYFTRNSRVNGLTLEERERLGGHEYMALIFLAFLVPTYFIMWQLIGCLAIGAWIHNNRPETARANGLNPWWVGAFNAVSAFNNSGMSLLDANMTAFQDGIFILLTMGLLILAGNTAYPCFLRLITWTMKKCLGNSEYWTPERRTLEFLLDHPRRVYTNMFPSRHTWFLAATIILLNGIDWAMFPILNIGNQKITYLSPGIEAVDGLFQALAVRSGGFYVVPIPNIRPALQVLYLVMMYINVYPVTITMRNSNVYEERSLGLFDEDVPEHDAASGVNKQEKQDRDAASKTGFERIKKRMTTAVHVAASSADRHHRSYFVRQQIRAQLSHDVWIVVLAVFLIMIVEARQFEDNPIWFSLFNVIFEVVSGYSCVGMTMGVPYNAFSFSGSWHVLSKLILCVVMLRGRHRGLPVALDHAVKLPGAAGMYDAEEDDARLKMVGKSATMQFSPA